MRSIRILVACSLLAAPAAGCKARNGSELRGSGGSSRPRPGDDEPTKLLPALVEQGKEYARVGVILPSAVWTKVVTAGGQEEGESFLVQVMVNVFAGQDRQLVNSAIRTGLGAAATPAMALANEPGDASRDEIATLAHALAPVISRNPKLLDTMASLDPATVPALQQALYERAEGDGNPAGAKPFMVDRAAPMVDLAKSDCAVPEDAYQDVAVQRAGTLVTGRPIIRDGVNPCFHETSTALALALNLLANNHLSAGNASVQLRTPDTLERTITSYQDLLAALKANDFAVELFTSRGFVEFKPFYWKDESGLSAVQLNTWIVAKAQGARTLTVRASAEHGESVMMIHKDGQRVAQVRWYAGLPDASFAGQAAMWRPYAELSAPWIGLTHEIDELYVGDDNIDGALQWLDAAANLMKGYQAVNVALKPPMTSYGLLVCTDSLSLQLLRIAQLRNLNQRMTQAFPIVRAQVRLPNGGTLDAFLEQQSGLNPGTLATAYPTDPALAADPRRWKQRLQSAFPDPADQRLRYFPELKAALQALGN